MTPKFAFGDAVRVTGYGVEYRSKNCEYEMPPIRHIREKGVVIKVIQDNPYRYLVLTAQSEITCVFEDSLKPEPITEEQLILAKANKLTW